MDFEQKLLTSDMGGPSQVHAQPISPISHAQEAERVERVLRQLTLFEKAYLLSGRTFWSTCGVPRLKLDQLRVSDGPHGMRGFCLHGDAGAVLTPCEMAMAATFDEKLITEVGEVIGEDAFRRGAHVLLGPCINMDRIPVYGRHFECFSEDPYLTSRAAVAYVKGVQQHVAACAKHFVCNDQEENRHTMNALVDERTLREVYLAPFEAAVREADVESIMCGYNRLNGSFCAENHWLLQKVLREEWGFKGWLISDWFGNQSTVPAITSGLNVEMPGCEPRHYGGYLLEACKDGRVSEEILDERCRPVLRTMLRRAGGPPPGASTTPPEDQNLRRRSVMHRAAAASHILLKNEDGALPLDPGVMRRLAVIGPFASEPTIQGGGSSRVRPRMGASIVDSLRQALPRGTVLHEPGCFPGELAVTTAEFEALKPIAACDAQGQPRGFRIALLFDAALVVATSVSTLECFRRFFMPWLRVLGLRQSDPIKAAEQEAKSGGHNTPGNPKLVSALILCGSMVGAIVSGMFAAGVWGTGWPRLRVTAGIASFAIVAIQAYRFRQQVVMRRREERMMCAAREAAAQADATVLVLGSTGFVECEGMDRPDMSLPGRQNELVEQVVEATSRPVIVVLNVGSPKELPWISKVSAVLMVHYGGEEMSAAVSDTLLGVSCPAGRLPMTWLRRMEDCPAYQQMGNSLKGQEQSTKESVSLLGAPSALPIGPSMPGETVYNEGLRIGYRAFGEGGIMGDITPLFPFGHGLSYTKFEYGPLEVSTVKKCAAEGGPRVLVCVGIRNTGNKSGAEVAQLYTEAEQSTQVPSPGPRALHGFARTAELASGEATRITIELNSRALGEAYSMEAGAWVQPRPGQSVRIDVGSSSTDIRTSTTVVLQ